MPLTAAEKTTLVAKAQATLDAANALVPDALVPPVVIPPTPSTGLYVHPSMGLTNCEHLCKATRVKWKRSMGDWIDKAGVLNGPVPTLVATGISVTLDISGIARDILIQGANSVTSVVIDGVNVTAKCFWTDPGSNSSLPLPSHYSNPVIVPQSGGKSMTVTASSTSTWHVDPIALPSVPDYPCVGGFRAPDIFDVACSSRESIMNTVPGSVFAGGPTEYTLVPPQPEFATTAGGMPYIRIPNRSTDFMPRLTDWLYPLPQLEEVYVAYAILIEPDVWDAMIELGVKLSGPGGGSGESFHFTNQQSAAWYGPLKNPANRQVFGLDYYERDVTTGYNNSPNISPNGASALLTSGRLYWIESYMKLNTVGLKDGIGRMWVNGHMVCDDRFQWRANPLSRINTQQFQIFHGGKAPWIGPCHYWQGRLCASTQYIGVPPEMKP